MLTPEQKEKAQMALIDKVTDDLYKSLALRNHNAAVEWVEIYNLPYRVSLDYLKSYSVSSDIVKINRCYPLAGYPVDKILTIGFDDLDLDNPDLYKLDDKGMRVYSMELFHTPKPDVMEVIEKHNRQFHTWEVGDAVWEYEFIHFLDGYHIDEFSSFDMFGRKGVDEDRLNERKRYFVELQDKYMHDKSRYRSEEPKKTPEDASIYTEWKFHLELNKRNT